MNVVELDKVQHKRPDMEFVERVHPLTVQPHRAGPKAP